MCARDYSELSSHLTNSESHTKSSLESATKTSARGPPSEPLRLLDVCSIFMRDFFLARVEGGFVFFIFVDFLLRDITFSPSKKSQKRSHQTRKISPSQRISCGFAYAARFLYIRFALDIASNVGTHLRKANMFASHFEGDRLGSPVNPWKKISDLNAIFSRYYIFFCARFSMGSDSLPHPGLSKSGTIIWPRFPPLPFSGLDPT